MFQPDLLRGKKILITGGGTGLGKSIGRRYLELGAELVICGRRLDVLEATAAAHMAATGGKVTALRCDIRDAAAVAGMMDTIWQAGPLDVLMNNAAGNFVARTDKLSARAVDAVLNVVLHGTIYCTLEAGKRWIAERRPAAVLNVVSTGALIGQAFQVASATAKAGVLSFTRGLAVEWGPYGIRHVAVAPGLFPTPGAWDRLFPPEAIPEPQEQGVPLRRLGDHGELADLCSFLISDRASYINGEVVVMDGGRWLQGGPGATIKSMQNMTEAQWEEMARRMRGG